MPQLSPPSLVTKRVAHLPALALRCGETLSGVTIGYETYGRLNDARDNVVLVCHHFSGASNAAGRYREDDPPGWWDAVIGPGKAIDTDRYFVVAIDALGCVRLDAPHGVTTHAASLDPRTGRPYGPGFPAIAIADMVAAQRLVLDQLGIERLAAVAGPSLGAMQALAWATERPEEVDRVI
ncbi:MAG: alpha/beta fold hydrolase, partial [Candidatus Sericytochromatia bacterium]